MRNLWTGSAMALLLSLGLVGVAHAEKAEKADKAADRSSSAGVSAGASNQSGRVATMSPQQLIGKQVVSREGRQLGQIRDVLVPSRGGAAYALVDLPGDATPPARQLMALDELQMKDGQLTWMSDRAAAAAGASGQAQSAEGRSGQGQSGQQQTSAMSQDKLRSSLQSAGFQDVRVVDAAYLVRAKSADGSPVFMMIDPPAAGATAGAAAGASQQPGQTQSGQRQDSALGQDKLRSALEKAGFKDISVLDAAYLVRAKSSDGTPVTMMIDAPMVGGGAQGAGSSQRQQ